MKTARAKRQLPLMSLFLLLVTYISFGWYLIGPDAPRSRWLERVCSLLNPHIAFYSPSQEMLYCQHFIQSNWFAVVLTVIWIFLSSLAFRSPLTSIIRIISRTFHSDTVAFLAIFMFAAMGAIILFWLHVFLFIITILATEALARIDIQLAGYGVGEAFWMLLCVCMAGLAMGVSAHYLYGLYY
ncbi:MAG TPA: hypothetical protein IGS53_25355 [Leptolyngbyaceae cyanobacterium M33_DOE_097]|uniref:Uncharacterized protein n=1 Tax=Oscillatoriales cyanobacterium SpSt-418 TaxID=2282169 RepID=A0A7C3KEP7_9CYAN|nr:hypothetical protein [Leptolyngbyaceae cyanobacterium M33_DOE_097]